MGLIINNCNRIMRHRTLNPVPRFPFYRPGAIASFCPLTSKSKAWQYHTFSHLIPDPIGNLNLPRIGTDKMASLFSFPFGLSLLYLTNRTGLLSRHGMLFCSCNLEVNQIISNGFPVSGFQQNNSDLRAGIHNFSL